MTDWIKCTDSYPKNNERVLAVYDGKTILYDCFCLNGNWHQEGYNGSWGTFKGEITHWMKFPELPND